MPASTSCLYAAFLVFFNQGQYLLSVPTVVPFLGSHTSIPLLLFTSVRSISRAIVIWKFLRSLSSLNVILVIIFLLLFASTRYMEMNSASIPTGVRRFCWFEFNVVGYQQTDAVFKYRTILYMSTNFIRVLVAWSLLLEACCLILLAGPSSHHRLHAPRH